MISVEARKHLGKNWVIVREWDGIDQPDYTRIFEITEEELEFEGGRFTRKNWMIPSSELIIAVPDRSEITTIEEIVNWIAKNTSKKWNFEIFASVDLEFIWKFGFESKKDAVAFKLRWDKIDGDIYEFYPGQWK